MRHFTPTPPSLRSVQLRKLFAIQRQAWRQTGLADREGDAPLTAEALYKLRERARTSLMRPPASGG
ncbi:hypothetical protein FIU97_11275 [Roseivivax sp. THAF40]|uniref:hypothetical protein n=1 Tax=unclassified Roseivivax TaxID=2639302 RepID=UPI0012682220|nr:MULTISPECIES: hypothetical protein [unclassified Roseivivax]QFS83411.1 hypothetical protein FIV09_11290 [Roseivivax sp. THAF197b]QFT47155.1 hypothetical protein FIU97_11275 [Roseivivax sp. THAF40]